MTTIDSPESSQVGVRLLDATELSPHSKAVYEAGKSLLINSISTSRDFAKFMISTCTGAIPVYLALLSVVVPTNSSVSVFEAVIMISPAVAYLIASVIFTFAYFPEVSFFSLDLVSEIERVHKATIQRRNRLAKLGFAVFIVGNILGIISVVYYLLGDQI